MNYKPSALITLLSLAAIILGGLLGYFFPDFMLSIEFVGLLFIRGLKFLVLPLTIAVVITGITALADTGKLNRSIGKLFLYFGASTFGAILVGLLASLTIQPGYLSNKEGAFIPSSITDLNELSFTKIISDLIPNNFMASTTELQVIGLIIFSILIGAALVVVDKKGKAVSDFFDGLKLITSWITGLFIWIAPFGLFSLVGTAFARNYHTEPIFTNLASFSVTLLLAILIHFLVILPVVLKLMGKQSPISFYKNLLPAFATAFGTASSVAALPVTTECLNEGTEVDQRATSLALPLGAIFNLNGTAIYLIVGSLFIAQLYGLDLSILFVLSIIFVSLLVSLGGSIIPNGSLLLLAVVLSLSGFPAQAFAGLGLLLVVDWFFDRIKVVVNVAGDAIGAAVLGESFDFKTATRTLTVGRALKDDKRSNSRYKQNEPSSRYSKTDRSDKSAEREKPFSRKKRSKPERKPAEIINKPNSEEPVETKKRINKRVKPSRTEPVKKEPIKTEPVKTVPAEKSEKKSTFDITKPPAILQAPPKQRIDEKPKAEIKSKPEESPKPPVEKQMPKAVDFNQETIERERAKISAHLEALKQKEKFKNYLNEENLDKVQQNDSDEKNEPTPVIPPAASPKIDYVDETAEIAQVQDSKTESKPEPEMQPEPESELEEPKAAPTMETAENVVDEPAITEEKPVEPITYGRAKPKRPISKKTDSETNEVKEDTEPVAEFDSENISFGRTKRKK